MPTKHKTIRIKADTELGYLIINRSEFAPKTQEDYDRAKKVTLLTPT